MSRGSPELTDSRKEEILNAFDKLFQVRSFRNISMRDVEQEISMTRSSIYNYFKTKEEILAGLITKEYQSWAETLYEISRNSVLTENEFANEIALSLKDRKRFLEFISWNHTEIEENVRTERLAEIQLASFETIKAFYKCLDKFFPNYSHQKKQNFQLIFFTFLYGIDSFIVVSEKQEEALKFAGIEFRKTEIYDVVYNFIVQFLKEDSK